MSKYELNEDTTIPNSISVLLNGFPKSGNYLVWKILYLIQSHGSLYQSYITQFPLSPTKTSQGKKNDYIFKHAEIIDGITINNNKFSYDLTWQSYGAPNSITPAQLFQNSSLLWCHDLLCNEKFELLNNNVKHFIYVYRDVESVLKSFAVHSLRFQQFNPKYSLRDPQEVIDNETFIVNNAKRWNSHVKRYLANNDKMLLINYEDLMRNKAEVIATLIAKIMPHLIDSKAQNLQTLIEHVLQQTSLSVMQEESEDHVNTKSSKLIISERNKALIKAITNETRELIEEC